jgi:hypothetical protein
MRRYGGIALIAAVLLAGCDSLSHGELAGVYMATTLTATEGGATADLLAAGASINLNLREGTISTGTLSIPGGAPGGGDLVADLTGSWGIDGDRVTLFLNTDVFLDGMILNADLQGLEGEAVRAGVTYRGVLQRL